MSERTILIVEDEAVVQLHIKRIVEKLGHTVIGAAPSMDAALALASETAPDLALVDLRLAGDASGFDVARELRERHGTAIVFVTAFADDATLQQSQDAGAVGYVVKPFSELQLRAMLTTAFAEHDRMTDLQLREQSLARVLTRVGDAVILVDADDRIIFFNPLASVLTGWRSSEAHGRKLKEVLHVEPGKDSPLPFSGTKSGSLSAGNQAVVVVSRRGRRISVRAEMLAINDPGEPSGNRAIVLHANAPDHESRDDTGRDALRERVADGGFRGMLGVSPVMLELFSMIEQLAGVDWTVLVEGETGTGKELTARALHDLSARSEGPFVAVNCAALTDSLLASQLFGHRKGAFTGAINDQKGVFEAAHEGTLFLDEIGDVSSQLQKSILRTLDENKITRLGESEPVAVDVRVVCATQRTLSREVEEGRFRADLFFRLCVAQLKLPPLRERAEDVPRIAMHFLAAAARSTGKSVTSIDDEAERLLKDFSWPGNIRELRAVIDRAVLACSGDKILLADIRADIRAGEPAGDPLLSGSEKEQIVEALRRTNGNRTDAARLLGISRATLYRRLAAHGIDDPRVDP